jgi:hypothetical protein
VIMSPQWTSSVTRIQLKEGTIVNQEGDLLGYETVYYSSCVAANVLSFFKMTKRFKAITYDNRTKDAFQITRDDDSIMEFKPSPEGLYYFDFADSIWRKKAQEVDKKALAMVVQTMEELKRNFIKRARDRSSQCGKKIVCHSRTSIAEEFCGDVTKRLVAQ